jgi:hypothetical protein
MKAKNAFACFADGFIALIRFDGFSDGYSMSQKMA